MYYLYIMYICNGCYILGDLYSNSPVMAKVEAITSFPAPQTKRELMRFLGMAGYYRKFC